MKLKQFLLSLILLAAIVLPAHADLYEQSWTVLRCSSEQTGLENGAALNIIDGDETTYWHTRYIGDLAQYPHSITFLHNGAISLSELKFVPRKTDRNYMPNDVTISVSDDDNTWSNIGTYDLANQVQVLTLEEAVTTQLLRLTFNSGELPYCAIGEIYFYGAEEAEIVIDKDYVYDITVTANESSSAVWEALAGNWSKVVNLKVSGSINGYDLKAFQMMANLTYLDLSDASVAENSYCYKDDYHTENNVITGFFVPSRIQTLILPTTITAIGDNSFNGCSSLASISIPSSVTSIGSNAFKGCTSLTSVTISGEGLVSIGDNAFDGCTNLASITLPPSVTSIGSNAFGSHNMIVTFASTTPCTQNGLGTNVKLAVPSSAVSTYRETWSDLANVIVDVAHIEEDVTVTANESESAVVAAIGEDFLRSVLKLKVSGTFNGYDLMVFRNKMINLMELDLSDANVVGNSYRYYENYYSKDNIITGNFVSGTVQKLILPKDITALEAHAFDGCGRLETIDLPEGITSIPEYSFNNCYRLTSISIPEGVTSIGRFAFYNCRSLTSINIPSTVTTIAEFAFEGCQNLASIILPKGLRSLGFQAFDQCYNLSEIHLPPYLENIDDYVFSSCNKLKNIYAYMPDIISIGTNTFNDYQHQQLYVPEFLYYNYFYDTNWSQFLSVNKRSLSPDDYDKVPTNSDIVFADGDERIPDMSNGEHVDGEINNQGSFTVEGDEPQPFDTVDQNLDGEGHGGSLIGEDDGEHEGNLTVNHLRVKINVKAGRWYFFCFPYDVIVAECEYPAQYAWRWYDGLARANGEGGWKPITSETLTAGQGYAFQTSHTGNLIITFDHPTFGGDRPKPLQAYASGNQANASWNFVGNPYSSFYDFMVNDFSSPITVYNVNGTYSAYRPGDDEIHLQPYEAFFVQKPTEVSSILFDSDRRETYRQSQDKKNQRQQIRRRAGIDPQRRLINLEILIGEELMDKTRVVLNNEASHAYEIACDAAKMMSNEAQAQLYSVENGINMAINERPAEGDIRLGYTAKTACTLSISASRMDAPMMLVDTKLGTMFDLSLGTYDFETAAGTFNDRFLLRPSGEATAINGLMAKTGVCIGTQEGGIAIGGAEGKTVNVYTTGGAQAAQHSGNGYIALKSGMYVVSVDGVSAKVSVK